MKDLYEFITTQTITITALAALLWWTVNAFRTVGIITIIVNLIDYKASGKIKYITKACIWGIIISVTGAIL